MIDQQKFMYVLLTLYCIMAFFIGTFLWNILTGVFYGLTIFTVILYYLLLLKPNFNELGHETAH